MLDLTPLRSTLSHEPESFHDPLDMADFPIPQFTEAEARAAGKILRLNMPWTPGVSDEAARIFKVAYDWRDSHAFPARSVRYEMAGRVRALKLAGITAGRLKRMRSIRKKLAKTTLHLTKIQDLGGCRAILANQKQVDALAQAYRNGASVHRLIADTDYIKAPKANGYRSHHLVLEYQGIEEQSVFSGRRVEIQFRTRLQHAWATAIEAVGLVRGEDLKGGEGDADWLRLFTLMASELAVAEKSAPVPGTENRRSRRQEIAALNEKLGAINVLSHMNDAFDTTERLGPRSSKYFLLQFDGRKKTIQIVGFSTALSGAGGYSSKEFGDSAIKDTVLVEMDQVENLRAAYPNYYLDVGVFTGFLRSAISKAPGLIS